MIQHQLTEVQTYTLKELRQEVLKLRQNNEVLLNCLEVREVTIDKLQRQVNNLTNHLNPIEVEVEL